jgi:hypothetical protein
MNTGDIIRMATEAGFEQVGHDSSQEFTARIERFAELVAAKERARIVELVDEYDGWIARQISGEPEEPLPDVDRAALLKEILPEIQKMFNVEYKERT